MHRGKRKTAGFVPNKSNIYRGMSVRIYYNVYAEKIQVSRSIRRIFQSRDNLGPKIRKICWNENTQDITTGLLLRLNRCRQ